MAARDHHVLSFLASSTTSCEGILVTGGGTWASPLQYLWVWWLLSFCMDGEVSSDQDLQLWVFVSQRSARVDPQLLKHGLLSWSLGQCTREKPRYSFLLQPEGIHIAFSPVQEKGSALHSTQPHGLVLAPSMLCHHRDELQCFSQEPINPMYLKTAVTRGEHELVWGRNRGPCLTFGL